MRKRYNAYREKNKQLPSIIYTKSGGSNYVTLHVFDSIVSRFDAYTRNNGTMPTTVSIEPAGSSKPSVILNAEKELGGTINGWGDFYELVRQKGVYRHYDCEGYSDVNDAITKIRGPGLNCADYTHVGLSILSALVKMGISHTWTIEHVFCNSKWHTTNYNAGHFLLKVDGKYCDLSQAADSRTKYGTVMCKYGIGEVVGHRLC